MNIPERDELVFVRSRQYLVDEVVQAEEGHAPGLGDTLVRLHCVEDDALGEPLEVLWEREVDARRLGRAAWEEVGRRGFDAPRTFSAYLHTLRWRCVTSTDAKLFQAPYRAGIEVKAYQLEPLRKALNMPRVNLFIADDVGLGKTIEAGLVLRELILRQKVRRVVIAAPPSVVRQWQDEMERRFGLTFVLFDREFVAARRRERGYGTNPWSTHTRFIVSHALLRDEAYAGPLRDWLGKFSPGALLILDEAHNAAPASGSKYAVDSQLTRAVRDISPLFEHRLFLSATPHNGHSNSFAALLEMLDPQRFCRGVPPDPKVLDAVMVRRLKSDLREVETDLPERKVAPIIVDGLPPDAPELVLADLLQRYRRARSARLLGLSPGRRKMADLVTISLQKRLLSSIEAFARTLAVHRRGADKALQPGASAPGAVSTPEPSPRHAPLLAEAPGMDDERADLPESEVQAEDDAAVEVASAMMSVTTEERVLLEEMTRVAQAARHQPDARFVKLADWIRANLCPDAGKAGARWLDRRVLIFTEYADTKTWLLRQLESLLAGSERASERVRAFHGGLPEEARDELQRAFNADPTRHPLRILVATDAAREGLNLQNHCADLFHFDVPWNPSRMEQRNGRLDRRLQKAPVVTCRYFVLAQRPEDLVLRKLVEKTEVIRRDLGSMSPVIDQKLARLLERGIMRAEVDQLALEIDAVGAEAPVVVAAELEVVRRRRTALAQQLAELDALLQRARDWISFDEVHFRDALSASLELMGAPALAAVNPEGAATVPARAAFALPALDRLPGADASWSATLDAVRPARPRAEKVAEWRRKSPILPVIFRDAGCVDADHVHLHLEHRVVQRLLGRFVAQGFRQHELSRACVLRTEDALPKIVALARLSLFGPYASRLHDEVVAVAAEWSDPDLRGRGKLRPLKLRDTADVLTELEHAFATPHLREVPDGVNDLLQAAGARDLAELVPHLDGRAEQLAAQARKKLAERAVREADEMRAVIDGQRAQIVRQRDLFDAQAPNLGQLVLPSLELQQVKGEREYWKQRLDELEGEIVTEPERVKALYEVKTVRVEPAGLVYLWPMSR
jgi:ERCC4-related helicase